MYNVEIYSGRNFNFKKFPQFKQVSDRTYKATGLTEDEAKSLHWKATINGKEAVWYEDIWDRSRNYKAEYFKKHKDEEFVCAYCGRKVPRSSITVDHVIPVYAVKHSRMLQKRLKRKGYTGINDERNLVHCCRNCNSDKGRQNSSIWVLKARLGTSDIWWRIRSLTIIGFCLAMLAILAYIMFRYFGSV